MTFDPTLAFIRHIGCDIAADPEPIPHKPGFYLCPACAREFQFRDPVVARRSVMAGKRGESSGVLPGAGSLVLQED